MKGAAPVAKSKFAQNTRNGAAHFQLGGVPISFRSKDFGPRPDPWIFLVDDCFASEFRRGTRDHLLERGAMISRRILLVAKQLRFTPESLLDGMAQRAGFEQFFAGLVDEVTSDVSD